MHPPYEPDFIMLFKMYPLQQSPHILFIRVADTLPFTGAKWVEPKGGRWEIKIFNLYWCFMLEYKDLQLMALGSIFFCRGIIHANICTLHMYCRFHHGDRAFSSLPNYITRSK